MPETPQLGLGIAFSDIDVDFVKLSRAEKRALDLRSSLLAVNELAEIRTAGDLVAISSAIGHCNFAVWTSQLFDSLPHKLWG